MTARLLARQHRHADALGHDQQALALYRDQRHVTGQATALNAIGWHHAHLGRPGTAIDHCRRALALHQQAGDLFGQGLTWDTLGMAYHLTADREKAMTHFRLAVAAMRSCGDRFHQAESLRRLGTLLLETGEVTDGCTALRQAAQLLTDLGHPDADLVHRKLTAATPAAGREVGTGSETALAGVGADPAG
jgi:tetratricopeptide (TPR) repeat protein